MCHGCGSLYRCAVSIRQLPNEEVGELRAVYMPGRLCPSSTSFGVSKRKDYKQYITTLEPKVIAGINKALDLFGILAYHCGVYHQFTKFSYFSIPHYSTMVATYDCLQLRTTKGLKKSGFIRATSPLATWYIHTVHEIHFM